MSVSSMDAALKKFNQQIQQKLGHSMVQQKVMKSDEELAKEQEEDAKQERYLAHINKQN